MSKVTPYLHFNGNCREAMEFYQKALGGKLDVQTVGESPMAAQWPAETHKNALHAMLSGPIELFGSDGMGAATAGNVSLCLVCSSKNDLNKFFANLSEGGNVTHPLVEEFFGTFGDLTDKFGLSWMLQLDPPKP